MMHFAAETQLSTFHPLVGENSPSWLNQDSKEVTASGSALTLPSLDASITLPTQHSVVWGKN
jgi:hypothetical protein